MFRNQLPIFLASGSMPTAITWCTRRGLWLIVILLAYALYASTAHASDHADPFDPLNRERLEGGITDLFVFAVDKNGKPVVTLKERGDLSLTDPLKNVVRDPLTDKQKGEIDSIVFILCVRRALTDEASLSLESYTYKIHIDTNSAIKFPTKGNYDTEVANLEKRKKMASSGGGLCRGREF